MDDDADAALFSELLGDSAADDQAQAEIRELLGASEGLSIPASDGNESETLREDADLLDALCAPLMAFNDELLAAELDVLGGPRHQESGDGGAEGEGSVMSQAAPSDDRRQSRAREARGRRRSEAKPRRSNPNKGREEQRRELLSLRSQVSEMEELIERLKATACGLAAPNALESRRDELAVSCSAGAIASTDKQKDHVEFTDVWRQMCLRQLNRRIEAERENARLKDAVSRRAHVTGAIQALLETPLDANDACDILSRKRSRTPVMPPTDPEVDREIFEQLSSDVDQQARKADKFFQVNGLLNVDAPCQGTQMREVDGGVALDVFAATVLPFDWQRASSGAWRFYKGFQKHFGPVYDKSSQRIGIEDDVVKENFIIGITASTVTADFRVRQVIKRFMLERQQLIVWRNDCQPVQYENHITNFGFRETGFVLNRPVHHQPSVDDIVAPVSILQVGYRISPFMSTATQSGRQLSLRANISDIAQFVFSSQHVEIRTKINRIEDLLINEHRSESDTTAVATL